MTIPSSKNSNDPLDLFLTESQKLGETPKIADIPGEILE